MADPHIAFISFPHSPHVNPTLPIVSALLRRGYRVSYATSDRFSSVVESIGAEVVPCSRFQVEIDRPKDPTRENAVVRYSTEVLDQISPFYQRHRPDLIVYDFLAFAGRILARQLSLPAVQTSPFYALSVNELERQVRHDRLRRIVVDHGAVMARFLGQHGIESANYYCDKERLNIHLLPRVLQPNSASFGSDCFFAGRCAVERAIPGQWPDHSGGRPIALVAMSTLHAASSASAVEVPRYYRMCIEALSGLGWHLVMCVADRCDASSLVPLPEHCEIAPYTAYLSVLARAKVLFFMSGTVSTTEAAYRGVPMVAISEGVAEFEWQAERLAEVGIGAHVSREELSAERLRAVVMHLTGDRKILERCQEVARKVRREPGGEETANRIEDYLHTGQ